MTYIQARYLAAVKLPDSDYAKGRMTGVCAVAEQFGYTGDDLSKRLRLLGEVLKAKGV